jgi:DNA-binding XRE family transcriptional regulator
VANVPAMPTEPNETNPTPTAAPVPNTESPVQKVSKRSSARKSAKPSAKRSSSKKTVAKPKASKKKAKAKRKASPKASPTTVVRKKSIRSSVGTSTTKGRQGIRIDGKPRATEKPGKSPADVKYGAGIALARRLKLLSQADVAKKIGVKQGYYSTIERGTNPAPDALKAKIKKALAA